MTVMHPEGHAWRLFATRAIFLIVGLGMAVWAPLVPVVKANLGLSEGSLGLLILCLGGGALLAMPLAGALAARLGLRRAIVWPLLLAFAAFPPLLLTQSVVLAALLLAIFGAGLSIADVAMNMQAVIVEEDDGRPRMSFFHGMWSVGGILGALAVSSILGLGGSPLLAGVLVIAAGILSLWLIHTGLIAKTAEDDDKPLFVLPRGRIVFLGVLCALAFLPEFSVLDWSAVFLFQVIGTNVATAGLGYAFFSVGMVGMRFGGDLARARFGDPTVLMVGGIVGAAGVLSVALSPALVPVLIGYLFMGLGIANIVPILFSIAGRGVYMPAHLALPAVVMVAQVGALGGPAIIGFVAEITSLRFAFALLALGVLAIAASYRVARD